MQARVVRPEILDTLPPDDPAAVANRKDLRFLNGFMGNWGWIGRRLREGEGEPSGILEAGAGEGDLGAFLLRKGFVRESSHYTGLDLWARPTGWPDAWGWSQTDLLEFRPPPGMGVFISNLLLHQFEDEDLQGLGRRLARIPRWIICEPLRVRRSIWGLFLLRPFGLHPVSWHDGRVSVRAGFRGNELVRLLRAGEDGRRFRVSEDLRGSYRLVSWIER